MLDAIHVFILTHMVEAHSYERCFDGLSGWRSQTQKRDRTRVLEYPHSLRRHTLPRPRFGIEWGQVDAIHRIPRIQEVMDRHHATAMETQGNKVCGRHQGDLAIVH